MDERAANSDLGLDEIKRLEEQGSIRLRKPADYRIDAYPTSDLNDPDRNKRIANHKRRVERGERAEWAFNVKIRDGWVCKRCGSLDREILEAHHIKSVQKYPDHEFEIDNGICLCGYCHSKAHWRNEAIRNKILARLALIYHGRYGKGCCGKT